MDNKQQLLSPNRTIRHSTTKEDRTKDVIAKGTSNTSSFIPTNGLSSYLREENVKAFNRAMIQKSFGISGCLSIEDRDTCIKECSEYFLLCEKYDMIPTISALSLYLGVNHNALYKYIANPNCSFRDILEQAVAVCHTYNEMGALAGKIPVTLFQFLSTNYYGLKNTQQVEIKPSIDKTVDNQETLKVIQEQIANETSQTL